MILLDHWFGLAAVEIKHNLNQGVELGLELAMNLWAMDGNLYNIEVA